MKTDRTFLISSSPLEIFYLDNRTIIVSTESNERVTTPGFMPDPSQLPPLAEKTQKRGDLLMMSSLTYITQISPNV
jgi:hypothetical protein